MTYQTLYTISNILLAVGIILLAITLIYNITVVHIKDVMDQLSGKAQRKEIAKRKMSENDFDHRNRGRSPLAANSNYTDLITDSKSDEATTALEDDETTLVDIDATTLLDDDTPVLEPTEEVFEQKQIYQIEVIKDEIMASYEAK